MSSPMTAPRILDREFLTMRAKLLELAASLDRIQRADDQPAGDRRLDDIRQAIEVLGGSQPDRAERIQMIFSRPYEQQWREQFGWGPGGRH